MKIEDDIIDRDADDLAALGHKQELQRSFGIWSILAIGFTTANTWTSIFGTLTNALQQGGIPTLVYGFIAVTVGQAFTALSLGEFAHAFPTAGGQYHWVAELSQKKIRGPLSYVTMWLTIGCYIMLTCSACVLVGQAFMGLQILANPQITSSANTIFWWSQGVAIASAALNLFGMKIMPYWDNFGSELFLSGFGFIVTIIVIPAAGGIINSSTYVFADFVNYTGWDSSLVVFMTGLISSTFGMAYLDAATHIAEEVPNPKKTVPLVMWTTVLVGFVTGFSFLLVVSFCMGDIATILTGPTGFPEFEIIRVALGGGSTPNLGVSAGIFVLCVLNALVPIGPIPAMEQVCGRLIYALARDGGFPFASVFAHVDSRFNSPIAAQLLSLVAVLVINCLFLGSTNAFNALISASVLMGQLSCAIPAALVLFCGRDKLPVKWITWGKFSIVPHVVSCLVALWYLAFFFLPYTLPVTVTNINYTAAIVGGFFVLMALLWIVVRILNGKPFEGPLHIIEKI
ncbi:hypothetical protein HK100_000712 [Physocladia obscura]|uniref:Amino acid transporter n=1 Tax=Physocladia obscura TaxID=109957 RepID=A0AAD5SY10_9FUNG|nr:hypothetical protein HK100_000712 [Physocladia obscura]